MQNWGDEHQRELVSKGKEMFKIAKEITEITIITKNGNNFAEWWIRVMNG